MTHAYAPQSPLALSMEQIIAQAVNTIVTQRDVFEVNQRGIEPTLPDDVTLKEFADRMAQELTQGQRIRLGQLAASFSLAAGRPVLHSTKASGKARLHAVSSLNRAMHAMGI